MEGVRPQHIRAMSAVLVSMFVVTLSATCFAQAAMSAADQTCCAAMASGCGAAMARDHDCCRTTSSQLDPQLTATPRHVLQAPALLALPVAGALAVRADIPVVATRSRAFDSSPPRPAPPAYLILSIFRV